MTVADTSQLSLEWAMEVSQHKYRIDICVLAGSRVVARLLRSKPGCQPPHETILSVSASSVVAAASNLKDSYDTWRRAGNSL